MSERDRSPIKKGEEVRITLVASTSSRMARFTNGIHSDIQKGTALTDLIEGERFRLDIGFDVMITSKVAHVGEGMLTTANSTYSFERVPHE